MQKYINFSGYRQLTSVEITKLSQQLCRAINWNDIKVSEKFSTDNIHNCFFRGVVYIGADVYINSVARIENIAICDGAYIENCGTIEVCGTSTFGNGVQVAVINEAGGREVPIFAGLTAQIAYITATYRHRTKAIERIEAMVSDIVKTAESKIGVIGEKALITNCKTLRNVNIGAGAILEGIDILSNGTIDSRIGQHTMIGSGVKMYDFIMSGNSSVSDGALIKRCFIGSAVTVSAITANDSIFFANSDVANGEFCSVFAGPFTVSHHASTLLIAGMFSFFNAGSGSNQSNHLFKKGPVHQGIHQRGCKFGSGAYVMLPALNGAFTTVIGNHKNHHNTENLPYSILTEGIDGKTYILPAKNIGTIGNARDIEKWVKRDKRDENSQDFINFEEENPFITSKIIRAIEILSELYAKDGIDIHTYNGLKIKHLALGRNIESYNLALDKFIGRMLTYGKPSETHCPDISCVTNNWVDAAGMFIPHEAMQGIIDSIEDNKLTTPEEIISAFDKEYHNYRTYAYLWALNALENRLQRRATDSDIAEAIKAGESASNKLRSDAEIDAKSDNSPKMMVSYGLDSISEEEKMADFRVVRKLI